jgi:hypothetical protein
MTGIPGVSGRRTAPSLSSPTTVNDNSEVWRGEWRLINFQARAQGGAIIADNPAGGFLIKIVNFDNLLAFIRDHFFHGHDTRIDNDRAPDFDISKSVETELIRGPIED